MAVFVHRRYRGRAVVYHLDIDVRVKALDEWVYRESVGAAKHDTLALLPIHLLLLKFPKKGIKSLVVFDHILRVLRRNAIFFTIHEIPPSAVLFDEL